MRLLRNLQLQSLHRPTRLHDKGDPEIALPDPLYPLVGLVLPAGLVLLIESYIVHQEGGGLRERLQVEVDGRSAPDPWWEGDKGGKLAPRPSRGFPVQEVEVADATSIVNCKLPDPFC